MGPVLAPRKTNGYSLLVSHSHFRPPDLSQRSFDEYALRILSSPFALALALRSFVRSLAPTFGRRRAVVDRNRRRVVFARFSPALLARSPCPALSLRSFRSYARCPSQKPTPILVDSYFEVRSKKFLRINFLLTTFQIFSLETDEF